MRPVGGDGHLVLIVQVDLLGMSIYDFTHPTDQQKIQSFITRKQVDFIHVRVASLSLCPTED